MFLNQINFEIMTQRRGQKDSRKDAQKVDKVFAWNFTRLFPVHLLYNEYPQKRT